MRLRGWIGSFLVVTAVLGGCSSSGKGSNARPVGAGASSGFGSSPVGVVAAGSAKQSVPADLAFVVVGLAGDPGSGFSQIIGGSGLSAPVPVEKSSSTSADHEA